ncbi:GAF domain-containing protein [Bosea sp. (in: a-proteobacteria)]|uniref:GAF domain-containing protein n=1 Tax=Bosea sp. (in: a-proteobacteria) TaxID=1871050 RepID=UPI0027376395|nr:GAF domain-containing protein [Bosea sp. (in: a-proteobacteria)]MDP3256539.1 GAF domain-containing protein [Bosea sp. (in: a-proteobacteria)]
MKLILPPAVATPAALQEQARLNALASYQVLDTPTEETFDRLTRLSKRIFNVSMTTVTFLDGHRQWFKSQQGLSVCETDREVAFCDIAIRQPDALIVPDATADPRFADNPLVTGDPKIRFYAGMQLRSPDGHAIGTVCVMDTKPRSFSRDDEAILAELSGLAIDLLELRRLAQLSNPVRRSRDQNRVLKAGRLVFNGGKSSLRCTVNSLSRDGAVVNVTSTAGLPERVALLIDADATSRLCDVAARSDQHLELAFES